MSVTLKIDNFAATNIKDNERTQLSADVEAGATSLPIVNSQNFAIGDPVLVGTPGGESGEIRTVAAVVDANTVTIDALQLRHNAYETVTVLRGQSIRIYRANNVDGKQPADNAFTVLEAVAIDPDQLNTTYIDPDGSSEYWYKFTYYNGDADPVVETSLADSGAARGGGIGIYTTVSAIRHDAGFDHNRNLSDTLISEKRKAAQDYINGSLSGIYTVPFTAPINAHIANITMTLAAGYLMLDQYGQDHANGRAKVDWAEKAIKAIRSGDVTLVDQAGSETVTAGGMGFSGQPNASTTDPQGRKTGPMFRISDRY